MRSRLLEVVFFNAFLALSTAPAAAQGTSASVSVHVASEGVAIPSATITMRNESTGFVTTALTSGLGQVVFSSLPIGGPYSVTVTQIGYRTETRTDHELALGSRLELDFELLPAPVQMEPVVVSAETESSRVGIGANARIDARAMAALPTLARNFTDLAGLAPTMGSDFSIGGHRATSTDIEIDGLQARNMLRGGELGRGPYTLSMEAIREFEVVVNAYDVSRGREGGGSVRAATQSGTNVLRGSLFVFHRDDALGAEEDFIGRGRDLRRLSLFQWGGSLGGPLVPSKVHFFVAADRQDSSEPLAIADLRTGQDELEAQVAADSLARMIDILRTGYALGSSDQIGVFSRRFVANTLFARIDWLLTERHRLTVRHNYSSFDSPNSGVGDQLIALLESRSSSRSSDHQSLVSLRSSWGGSLENELKLGLSISDRELTPNTLIPRGFVRVRSVLPGGTSGDVRLQFGGNRLAPEESGERQIQLANTTFWQRGRQLLTFGFDHSLTFLETFIPTDEGGLFEFESLADLERKVSSRYSRQVPLGNPPRSEQNVLDLGVFGQTEWQVNPRLAVTLGLRYDVSAYLTGADPNELLEERLNLRTDHTPTDWDNVQPRVQAIWESGSESLDVVRVGAGAFTAQPHYYLQANNIFFSGTQLADVALTGEQVPTPDFTSYRDDLSTVPGVPTGSTPPAYVNVMGENFESPTVWKADVSYERSVFDFVRVSVSALYARTFDNYQYFDRNLRDEPAFELDNEEARAVFVPAATIPANGRTAVRNALKFTEFTNVLELVSSGRSTQRALVVRAQVTPPRGGLISLSATWNRTTDNSTFNCCIARTASLFTPVESDPRDLSGSLGPSDFDYRWKVTGYAESPTWNGLRLGVRYVGNTGRPFSLVVNGDINGDGYSGNDLAFVFDPDDSSTPTAVAESMRRILANEESVARDYIADNLGRIADRNGGHAPWVQRVDVRVSATLPAIRGQRVEVTADIFNFLNLVNSDWGGQYLLPQGISASNPISQQLALLNVVGFDQTTRRYVYTVNENVGMLRKRGDPFQIQLGVRYLIEQ